MRGRSYGYSPSPSPRDYSRRYCSPSPMGRYRGRGRDLPISLLVRNLHRDTRNSSRLPIVSVFCSCRLQPSYLHPCLWESGLKIFTEFGHLKDIYLPRDYYTGEPRGFGFVQYVDPADAADAKYHMDGQILLGRELTVVFAAETRKKPSEMRARQRGRSYYDRRPHSRLPGYDQSYSYGSDYTPSPRRARHNSRSYSPSERRYRERSYSSSPHSRMPSYRSFSRSRSRSLEYSS